MSVRAHLLLPLALLLAPSSALGVDRDAGDPGRAPGDLAAVWFLPEQDTWLEENHPDDTHGTDQEGKVKNAPGDDRYALYRFGLEDLPAGVRIASATLEINCTNDDNTGFPVLIHSVSGDWDQTTATWNTTASLVDTGTTRASFFPFNPGWYSVDVTALVQSWIDGDIANHGLALRATSFGNESRYTTRDEPNGAERTYLRIDLETGFTEYAVAADSWIDEGNPGNNFGNDAELRTLGTFGSREKSLFRFDLAALTPGRPYVAILELPVTAADDTESPVLVRRVGASWTELGVNWSNIAFNIDGGTVWGQFSQDIPGNYRPGVTDLVRAWADGTWPNRGLALEATSSGTEAKYTSKEWGTPSERPRLWIADIGVDLAVTKAVDVPTPAEADTVRYSVQVTNAGPHEATGVVVDDLLPAGLTWSSSGATQGSYDRFSGVWNVGDIEPAAGAQLFLVATVDAGTAGTQIWNTAQVTDVDQPDTQGGNDADSVAIDVQLSGVDVALTKAVDDSTAVVGQTVTFLVTADNLGINSATSVAVADLLPPGLTHKSSTVSQGFYNPGFGTWSVGEVKPGVAATLEINAEIDLGTEGSRLENVAFVSFLAQPDQDLSNNADSAAVVVLEADLAVSKSADDRTPIEGQAVEFTVGASNLGPTLAPAVSIADALPVGLTYVSDSTTAGAYVDSSGVWSVGDLANGAAEILWITATVDSGTAGTTLVNGAGVKASEAPDPDPTNNAAADTVTVVAADLAVVLGVDDTNPREGGSIRLNVQLYNLGPTDAGAALVSDLLPAGLTWTGDVPDQGTYDPVTGLWNVGAVPVGGPIELRIDATVDAGTGGLALENIATILASGLPDPNPLNNADSVSVVVQSADLEVTKTVSNPRPNEGDGIIYTLTLRNLGPNDVAAAAVVDSLPAGLTYVTDTPSQGSYDDGTGLWTVGAVDSGQVETLAILANVDAGTGGTLIDNIARVGSSDQPDPFGGNDADSAAVTVQAADLAITKTVNNAAPQIDTDITFTIGVANAGPDSATTVQITDVLPANLTFQSSSPSQGGYDDGTGLWTVGTIAAGDSATLGLVARVEPAALGQTLVNLATITGVDQADSAPGNEADSAVVNVSPVVPISQADLEVAKDVSAPTPSVGDTITWTIEVRNDGPDAATNVEVFDLLPADLTWVADTPTVGTYVPGTGVWSVGGLAVAAAETLTVDTTVDPSGAGRLIANTASASADEPDTDATHADTATITVKSADLSVTKMVDDANPTIGDTVAFTVVTRNAGPDPTAAVAVADSLPAGLVYAGDSATDGSYDSGTGLWTFGPLAAADSASLTLFATVGPATHGQTLWNRALVATSAEGDSVSGNNADSVAVVVRSADLSLSMGVDDPTPAIGDSVTFSLSLSNLGPDGAGSIELTNALPAGLTHVAGAASQGAWDGGLGLWSVGTLAAGGSATLDVTATADPGTGGSTLWNLAGLAGRDTADPVAGNDADSASVTVIVPTGVFVSGSQPGGTAGPGQNDVLLFTAALANSHVSAVTLQEMHFRNVTVGPGSPAELDAELGTVRLHRDDGDGIFQAARDPLLTSATAAAGVVSFTGLSVSLPSGAAALVHAVARPALSARDGDLLDLRLENAGSVVFQSSPPFINPWPVDPPGGVLVDGMRAGQIAVDDLGARTVAPDEVQALVLSAILPANGYEADVLNELRVVQTGTLDPAEIAVLKWYEDGGDGIFDEGGPGDDVFLGPASRSGGIWSKTGLSSTIPVGGLRVFASVNVAPTAVVGETIKLVFQGPGATGVVMASGNSGPLDAVPPASSTLTVALPPTPILVQELPQAPATVLPGADPDVVFRFRIDNQGLVSETLTGVTLTNATLGGGSATQADLDASWQPLEIQRLRPADVGGASGVGDGFEPVAPLSRDSDGIFSSGTTTFTLDEEIAPGDSAIFRVRGAPSVLARDTDRLDLVVAGPADLTFGNPVALSGIFPLDPSGDFLVDGMSAAQIGFGSVSPSLLTGVDRSLALDILLPANGYEADTLERIGVVNLGNAQPGEDISRMEIWRDDEDGAFEPGQDTLLGDLTYTGDRWERTGLAEALTPGSGGRLFVTVDIADLATANRVVQLALPGLSDVGVGVGSGNDGPLDGPAAGSPQTISTVDRVTISPVSVSPTTASPGDSDVLLLAVAASNSYTVDKTMSGLILDNATVGSGTQGELDGAISRVALWADNGDLVFKGAPEDTVLATGFFEAGQATFGGFGWVLAPGSTRRLFVTGDVSLLGAADGDQLASTVASGASVTFALPTALAASWPLSSGGTVTVDGMVAVQIATYAAPPATLGPGEGPALGLDFTLPANGHLSDELQRLSVVNLGTANATDLAEVRLWRDGGDGAFNAGGGDDLDLGALAFFGGEWSNPTLAEAIPVGGARHFLSVSASAGPTDSASVRLAIDVDGIEMASGNDGPIDVPVESGDTMLLSTAILLASLEISPAATIIDSTVTATMTVRNLHATATIDSVAPSPLTVLPGSALTLLGGPSPAQLSLAPSEEQTFTWTYRASFIGEGHLRGSVSGVEAGGGPPHQSLDVTSNDVQIFVGAQSLEIYAVESMPFSINRGQQGVVPLTLTFENPSGPSGTDIRVTGLRVRLVDEQGAGIVPADLLTRVVVNEGAVVYLDKASLETSGDEIDLTLASPVLVESSGSSSQATVGIAFDISDSTAVPNFRVEITAASWIDAEDVTTGAPVTIDLLDPPAFPVSSGLARVVAEATRLDVAAVAAPDLTVGRGQNDIALLELTLLNPDPSGLAADVRVTELAITLADSAGVALPDPATWLERIRVRTPAQVHLDRPVGAGDDTTLTLSLAPLVSVPVNAPVPLTIEADIAALSTLGTFRVRLADSSLFEARDANTGVPLPVVYAADPLAGPAITVQSPVDSVTAGGLALMPSSVPVGSMDVPALTVVVDHPGGAETAPVIADRLTLGCRDDANTPVVPSTVLDRIRVVYGGTEVGLVTDAPATGGEVTVPLAGVVISPGGQASLEVRFDVEVTAPASLFQMTVGASGIGAMDANLMLPVTVRAAGGAEFPLSSGLAQLEAPARTLAAGFAGRMPAALAADGVPLDVATLTVRNAAAPNSGVIRMGSLSVRASDGAGTDLVLGGVIEAVTAWRGDEIWAEHRDLDPSDAVALLVAADTLSLAPDDPADLRVEIELRPGASSEGLRIGFLVEDVGVVQPGSPLLSVSVLGEEGQSFPFWTAAGNFGGTTLGDSYSNFPNPFAAGRELTTVAFYLPQPAQVSLKVYTLRGEPVRTLLAGEALGSGLHQEVTWDGRNGQGDVVGNGTYVAEISVQWSDGRADRLLRKVAVVR